MRIDEERVANIVRPTILLQNGLFMSDSRNCLRTLHSLHKARIDERMIKTLRVWELWCCPRRTFLQWRLFSST